MKSILGAVGFAVAIAVSAPASAVLTTWSANDSIDFTSGTLFSTLYCGANGTGCQTTTAGLTDYITLKAYSTQTSNAVTSTWVAAQLTVWDGGGIGIRNGQQGATEDAAPQHAIDNSTVKDILVVDFGANYSQTNFASLTMGYQCVVSANCGTGAVDVDAFVGGSAVGAGSAFTSATALSGYTELNFTGDANTSSTSTSNTRTDSGTPNAVGRYLVVTAGVGTTDSAFKLKTVTGTLASPPNPPSGAPIPGSLPLLGLGMLALGFSRRRAAKA